MLDTDTKRRIDTARDILVGKVPDPKSQVEQITIALIYKFMDDMDAESEEFGGKRKFFAGEFARYGWAKLMRSGLGGHETLNLYAEAIAKMPENPGIPPLFRDIFKNAYLPYRDPETLRAFLKIIDEFTLRPQRTPRRRLRVSALRARLPGRRRAVPHPAPHHRLHGRHHRPEEDRYRARSRLRHGGFSHLGVETHITHQHYPISPRGEGPTFSFPSPSGRGARVRAGDC